jgi:radical SAM enzyme (TIGR01210 family)
MPLVTLKTRPCHWFLHGGGCTTCGYNLVADLNQEITKEHLLTQTRYFTRLLPSSSFPFITLTSCGSFMDPGEIDDETRLEIFTILDDKGYSHINFESRPEFLRDTQRLQRLHEAFHGSLSVGIGLESSNDYVRKFCVNKGYTTRVFKEATRALNESEITYDAYILCGKPFLSPREDIEDAIKSIKFAFESGCQWVILMTANLQRHTLVYFMHEHGIYSLPKLWTTLEIMRRLPSHIRKNVILKGIDKALPHPLEFASNCEYCTASIVDAHIQWNLTQDYSFIEDVLDSCQCKQEWEQTLDDGMKMEQRVEKYYRILCNLLDIPFE